MPEHQFLGQQTVKDSIHIVLRNGALQKESQLLLIHEVMSF